VLSSGTKCYLVELMLSCGANVHVEAYVVMWDIMLSCGTKCYHVELMLVLYVEQCYDAEANVVM
jgi:hypothetical protein